MTQYTPPEYTPSTVPTRSRTQLITAFGIILLIASLIGVIGLFHSRQSHERLRSVVDTLNVKSKLVTAMHNAARERNLALFVMATAEDPFVRDEMFIHFNHFGNEFARARMQLVEMKLTDKEQQLLEIQGQIAAITIPKQRQVADLSMEDRQAEAILQLNDEVMPLQSEALEILRDIQVMQNQAISETSARASSSHDKAHGIISVLVGLAIILGIIVARIFIRRIQQAERDVYLEKELAEVTLSSIGDAVITTDLRGNIQFMNSHAEQMTGWKLQDAVNLPVPTVFQIFDEEDYRQASNPVRQVLNTRDIISSSHNIVLRSKNNTEYAIEHTAAPILDSSHQLHGVILIFRDVSEMRTLSSKLTYQATHDALTGLINRREFEHRLIQAIENAHHDNQQHAVCYIDLDQFKIINDTAGHAAGDELLKQLSGRLSPLLRRSDVLARLGGDEFGVLLEGCDDKAALHIAGNLLEEIKRTRFSWGNNSYEIGASIGMVPINALTGSISDVLSAADTACYEAKEKGRNCIHVFDQHDEDLVTRRGQMHWANTIRHAINTNQFDIYCQQILPLNGHATASPFYELLIRMRDSEKNPVYPMAFIPAAERYSLMPLIDRWMLEHALRAIENIASDPRMQDAVFTINFAGQSLSDDSFLDYVMQQVRNTHINPAQLCFEITETTAISSLSKAAQFIKKLRELGCQFALDDFGSGLCSFSYLKHMPVDYLKIDGSFIRDICNDPIDRAFVEAIHRVGRLMAVKTIAEYVEHENTLEMVQHIGIDYAQGFHLSRPQPLKNVLN